MHPTTLKISSSYHAPPPLSLSFSLTPSLSLSLFLLFSHSQRSAHSVRLCWCLFACPVTGSWTKSVRFTSWCGLLSARCTQRAWPASGSLRRWRSTWCGRPHSLARTRHASSAQPEMKNKHAAIQPEYMLNHLENFTLFDFFFVSHQFFFPFLSFLFYYAEELSCTRPIIIAPSPSLHSLWCAQKDLKRLQSNWVCCPSLPGRAFIRRAWFSSSTYSFDSKNPKLYYILMILISINKHAGNKRRTWSNLKFICLSAVVFI